jgi:hypothetical protein
MLGALMIRRMLGIRTGPRGRSARNPRQNFDSLTPVILVPRPRFRSLNNIMYGQAGGAEVDMQEEQDDGVQFGWEEQFGPEPAEEDVEQVQPAEEDAQQEQLAETAENDLNQPLPYFMDLDMSEFLNLDNDGGWGQEDVAGPAADDAVHQEAEEDAELQPFPYFVDFDINEFLNLDYDGGWSQEDAAGLAVDDAGHQEAEEDAEQDKKQMMQLFLMTTVVMSRPSSPLVIVLRQILRRS